jgi:beta-phosphoglucomutase-like phosphatase (HAD superfamily)
VARLVEIRRALAGHGFPRELAVFAVGSLGRFESSAASDLDFAVVYSGAAIAPELAATAARHELAAQLRARGHDVLDKTFRAPIELGALLGDIGGEGRQQPAPHLPGPAAHRGRLAGQRRGRGRGHRRDLRRLRPGRDQPRPLPQLAAERPPPLLPDHLRRLPLQGRERRQALGDPLLQAPPRRKLWHLANLALFCRAAQLPDDERDLHLAHELPRPPLLRVCAVLRDLGGLGLAGDLVRAYDGYLAALADPQLRRALDQIDYAAATPTPCSSACSPAPSASTSPPRRSPATCGPTATSTWCATACCERPVPEEPGCLSGQVIVFDLIGVLAAPSWRELCPADRTSRPGPASRSAPPREAEFWSDEAGRAYRAALALRRDRLDLLARLRARDIAIVIASNFAAAWLPTIRERMPAGLVDRWLVSGELGVAKPAAGFWTALRRHVPAGTLVVDDQRANCAAATRAGLRGLWAPAGAPLDLLIDAALES